MNKIKFDQMAATGQHEYVLELEGQLTHARQSAWHQEDAGETCREDCSGCNDPVGQIAAELKVAQDLAFKRGRLMYRLARLARHVRNTEELPITQWGAKAMDLLADVLALDPDSYDTEVRQSHLV